jgi:hypothetical protein
MTDEGSSTLSLPKSSRPAAGGCSHDLCAARSFVGCRDRPSRCRASGGDGSRCWWPSYEEAPLIARDLSAPVGRGPGEACRTIRRFRGPSGEHLRTAREASRTTLQASRTAMELGDPADLRMISAAMAFSSKNERFPTRGRACRSLFPGTFPVCQAFAVEREVSRSVCEAPRRSAKLPEPLPSRGPRTAWPLRWRPSCGVRAERAARRKAPPFQSGWGPALYVPTSFVVARRPSTSVKL